MQMADRVDDPKMKDTLFASATQLLDSMESGKQPKKNPKGIGSIFGNLFGIGHHAETPAASDPAAAPAPAKPAEASAAAPEAVAPGSQTFGGLGGMFGSELQAKPAVPPQASTAPQIPPVPNVDMSGVPPTKELQGAGAPFSPPTLSSARGTPISTPVGPMLAPAPGAAPQKPASPDVAQFPLSDDILAHAKDEAAKQFPEASQMYQRAEAVKKLTAQNAGEITRRLLAVTDQHLTQNGHIRTALDAAQDPQWGADFRAVMDAVGNYEDRGLIPKGTLERWHKVRFMDGGPSNDEAKTVTLADGTVKGWDPGTRSYSITVGPAKAAPIPTWDDNVNNAFSTPEAKRTPEQANLVAGYMAKKAAGDQASMSPTDLVESAWLKANENMPIAQKASKFQALFHPLQPTISTLPGVDQKTGKTVIYIRKGDKLEPTEIATPGPTFIPERYQKQGTMKVQTKVGSRTIENEVPTKLYSAESLIAGHSAGDVTLDTLTNLIKAGVDMSPEDKVKLSDYVNRLTKPAF